MFHRIVFSVLLCLCTIPFQPKAFAESEEMGEGIFITRNVQPGAAKRIAIATVIISGRDQEVNESSSKKTYQELVSFATKSKELYARRYGYDLIVATQKLDTCFGIGSTRPLECAWTKLALLSRVLQDYDWVFWSDADSVILNFDVDLAKFLDETHDIVAATNNSACTATAPYEKYTINTGEVFYKNSEFSEFVIREAWKNHTQVTPGRYEQMRINKLLSGLPELERNRVLVYPMKPFNVAPNLFREGDFILHLYGYHGKELNKQFLEIEKKYGRIVCDEEARQAGS